MITAEELQGYLVLLRQGPAGHKQHGAGEVVEVVAHNHFDSIRTAHCSINPLNDRNWTVVGGNARAVPKFHIVDIVTWRMEIRERCKWVLCLSMASTVHLEVILDTVSSEYSGNIPQ